MSETERCAIAFLQHGDSDLVGVEHAFGRENDPASAAGVVAHLYDSAAGSAGIAGDQDAFAFGVIRPSLMPEVLRAKRAGRHVAVDVGVVQRVELHPQHVALEADGVDAGFLLGARLGVLLRI